MYKRQAEGLVDLFLFRRLHRPGEQGAGDCLLYTSGLGLPQHFHVGGHVGDLQLGQAVLPLAEKVPGAPQFQV